ncbi:unnamed protein product [Ceutorhynchus assimilis]|uniref:OTU domain-containing protein n=1 Tax=Ceutorhynchus assimilis TaxID=467358 RepID=A0A9N9MII8_9CUCU|nr:unnamed protein product [Ceutorhynchus assimilis]
MKIQNKGKTNCDSRDMEASTLQNRRDVSLTVDVDEASGATPLNGTTRMATNKDDEICSKPNQKISSTRENIIGDVSCLFRAESLHMYGHQDSHDRLRQDVVKYIRRNWKNLVHVEDRLKSASEYCTNMSKTTTFETILEILALVETQKTTFKIYSSESQPTTRIFSTKNTPKLKSKGNYKKIIHLLLIGDHLAGSKWPLKPVIAKNDNDIEAVDFLSEHELAENNEQKGEAAKMIQYQENESEPPDSVSNTKENGGSESTIVVGSVSENQRIDDVLLNTQEMLNKALQENLTPKLLKNLEEYQHVPPENRPKLRRLRCNKRMSIIEIFLPSGPDESIRGHTVISTVTYKIDINSQSPNQVEAAEDSARNSEARCVRWPACLSFNALQRKSDIDRIKKNKISGPAEERLPCCYYMLSQIYLSLSRTSALQISKEIVAVRKQG